jgi:hypothetical protein
MSADEIDESEEETKAINQTEKEATEKEADSEDEVDEEDLGEENE